MGRFLFASLGLLVVAFSLSGTGANLYCPFDWLSYNVSCYKLFYSLVTWDQAQRFCVEQQENSQLASIHDVGESVKLSNYISQRWGFFDVWMGLRLSKRNGIWEWSDGSNLTYTSWKEGEPNNLFNMEFCAVLSAGTRYLQWNDKKCTLLHPFLCQFQPRSEANG
uniref:C-type lectin 1 n=1 Tax=Hydrophis hardwickii TaxID=8781 RepID=LECM1_HYDHA|nr:RecName: Full=C-type lectin 1; Short=CTL; Flags: Precursor [Hydrophis hardwickii]ABN54808.1 C-type lectin-like protein 1 [Hydrophis hardwickii]